jgi:hypothetical protein
MSGNRRGSAATSRPVRPAPSPSRTRTHGRLLGERFPLPPAWPIAPRRPRIHRLAIERRTGKHTPNEARLPPLPHSAAAVMGPAATLPEDSSEVQRPVPPDAAQPIRAGPVGPKLLRGPPVLPVPAPAGAKNCAQRCQDALAQCLASLDRTECSCVMVTPSPPGPPAPSPCVAAHVRSLRPVLSSLHRSGQLLLSFGALWFHGCPAGREQLPASILQLGRHDASTV